MVSAKWHEPDILLRVSRIRAASGQPKTFPALSRMSLVGGRPDVARRWSELLLLAKSGHRGQLDLMRWTAPAPSS